MPSSHLNTTATLPAGLTLAPPVTASRTVTAAVKTAVHTYRPDIDGLRAVAVALVVLFHAGIAGFSGGFVGVDVFFVISGYLIISIIAREQAAGKFSLIGFYERRARRILPAFFGMMIFCIVAGVFIMRPWDTGETWRGMKHSLLSVSNILFQRTAQDYFAGSLELMPFLHTWSLAVEEQFYLFIPLLMMALCRGPRRVLISQIMLTVVLASSLLWSTTHLASNPSSAFYLLPSRAWELAIGGLLAVVPLPALGSTLRNIAGLAGLAMILAAGTLYSHATPFPGPAALLPCMGAVLIIMAGTGGHGIAARVLSLRPLVFAGLISYSVYLWHWPLFAFAKHIGLRQELPAWLMPVLAAASFVAGALSWKFIEQPFRVKGKWTRRGIFAFSAAGLVALLGVSVFMPRLHEKVARMPAEATRLAAYQHEENPAAKQALSDHSTPDAPFLYGASVPPSFALWGDSHADCLADALDERSKAEGVAFEFYGRSGAIPLSGSPLFQNAVQRDHQRYTEAVMEKLLHSSTIKTVILASRWAFYVEGNSRDYGPAEAGPSAGRLIIPVPGATAGAPAVREAFATMLRDTITRLQQAGKTVVLVYPVPETAHLTPQYLAEQYLAGRDPASIRIPADGIFHKRQAPILAAMDSLPDSPSLIRVKPHTRLIQDGSVRLMNGPDVLYFDEDHLSRAGTRYILPLFDPLFASLKTGTSAR